MLALLFPLRAIIALLPPQLAAEYVEKALFKKVMTKFLNGSTAQLKAGSADRKAAIVEILRSSHLEVDESLLKLLKSAYDGSGMCVQCLHSSQRE